MILCSITIVALINNILLQVLRQIVYVRIKFQDAENPNLINQIQKALNFVFNTEAMTEPIFNFYKPVLLKCFLIVAFFSLSVFTVQAQNDSLKSSPPFWQDKLFTGGNFGLAFGTVTIIEISPLLGYKVTKEFSVGAGLTYMYFKTKSYGYNYSSSIYGGSLFTRYFILENIFAHLEYEVLNREIYDDFLRKTFRKNIPGLYIGGGYQQEAGLNSSFNVMLLWNLNQNPYSLNANPIIRAGVNIGF